MQRLAVLILALVLTAALGCRRAPPEEGGEAEPDTVAADTMAAMAPDTVRQWIRVGEQSIVRTPFGRACLFVPADARPAPPIRSDFVRIAIRPWPPNRPLPGAYNGYTVFRPIYEFTAHDPADQEFSEFVGDSLIVAMCVGYQSDQPGETEAFQRALLARPDPENPDALQLFTWKDPPEGCQLTCAPRGQAAPAQGAAAHLGRWLTGTLVTPIPAYAAETEFKGIGGGGPGNSPFAAVDSLSTGSGSETQ